MQQAGRVSTTGIRGDAPPFWPEDEEQIAETVRTTEPIDHDLPGHTWTVPQIRASVEPLMGQRPSRTRLPTLLRRHGLSWQKCRTVLGKADPPKRQAFSEQDQESCEEICEQETILIYSDEVHLHRDLDLGSTWASKGEPAYRQRACAPLSDRINWYGAYNFPDGECFIWQEGACHKENTALFLERGAEWLGDIDRPVIGIGDGAPWHRAPIAQQKAQALGFRLVPLPGYSPALNPIEGLWKWLREQVTQNHSYHSVQALFAACQQFIDRINSAPEALIQRLWPQFELDPVYDKLLVA